MDGWTIYALFLLVAAIVIALPLAFVLRALTRLSERTTALMHALEEVQVTTAAAARLEDVSTLEHPGGA